MLRLGRRLLFGDGLDADPGAGVDLIERATEQGDAEACAQLATLTAAGAWTIQSWPRTLDLLERAATLGSADAREQLILLASDRGDDRPFTQGPTMWRILRERIDLERYVIPPQPEQICSSPRVWRADRFASAALCERLIACARGKLRPARMYNRQRGTLEFMAIRTNSEFHVDITQSDVMLVLLRIKIGLLVSLPPPHMEPPQILHYAPGQELKAHFDFLAGNGTDFGRNGKHGSDRVVTFLLYLNEDYDGGETEFPKADLRYKGRKGDAIFFANLKSGEPDPMSLHCGRPVARGEKWLFSQWVHDGPFTA